MAIVTTELRVYNKPGNALPSRPVFFVPGWGFDGRVLELGDELPWLAPLGPVAPATFADQLAGWLDARHLPAVDLVGWSMGAYCALEFAQRFPERVFSLTLLAMRETWPVAEIAQLKAELDAGPRDFLAAFYRTCFLGYQEQHHRFARQLEPRYLELFPLAVLHQGLDYMARFRMPAQAPAETVCCHGRRDRIAPHGQRAALPGARLVTMEHAGHPLFLDKAFVRPAAGRKKSIRHRFSQAAATYDQHADVQAELAATLATACEEELPVRTILELGCGTGNYTLQLARRFPAARLIGLDFSESMLQRARAKVGNSERFCFLCEDAELFLAAGQGRFDLITANATLQWFENLEKALADIKALLGEEGQFWGAVFGRDTLPELEAGLVHVFGGLVHAPARRFPEARELAAMAGRVFGRVAIQEVRLERRYASLGALLHHFKKTGTGGWHAGGVFWGKQQLRALESWFLEQHGEFRITFQVFLVRCR